MASPQTENGYTKIANEIMDALIKYRIPGEEMQVLLCIIRESYGWNKKDATLSYGDISKKTGIKRQNVQRSIKSLYSKLMIGVLKNDDRCKQTFVFNKDYDKWVVKPVLKTEYTPVLKTDDRSVLKTDAEKRVVPLYEKKKEIYSKFLLKNGELYTPENDFVETLKSTFPDVDFEYEFKKISVWCLSNPDKRKTQKGAKKFITSWMTRAQDRINASKPTKPNIVSVEF